MNRRISVPTIVSVLAAMIVVYGAVSGLAAVTSTQPPAPPSAVTPQAITTGVAAAQATTPIANDDSYSVALGATLTVSAPGVLANDVNASQAIPLTAPSKGSLTLLRTGRFVYDPQGATGTVTFSYKASNGSAMSNNAAVTITISGGPGTTAVNAPGSNGAALYSASCAACHGADGNSIAKAPLGPTGLSNAQLVNVLSPGGKMSSYTSAMSTADIQAVADYVGTLGVSTPTPTPTVPPVVTTPPPPTTATPSAAATLFANTCAGCHSQSNLASRGISNANLVAIMTTGAMKTQAANLSPSDITAVAAFINGPTQGPTTPQGTPASVAPTTGASAYVAFCGACHGANGSGTALGPDIVGESRSEIIDVVRKGDGTMPAFSAAALSDKLLADLATYMETFTSSGGSGDDDGHGATVGSGDGPSVYTSFCAACHGPNGRGTSLGPDIVGEESSEIFKVVRKGDGTMPAFSFQTLSDKQLAALADYIGSWSSSDDDHDKGDSKDEDDH
ncbi:MAG: c-type cytochrome [Actinomycetia bacterium]|nr:c-type cytochrome [Actinomycetes bacterium]